MAGKIRLRLPVRPNSANVAAIMQEDRRSRRSPDSRARQWLRIGLRAAAPTWLALFGLVALGSLGLRAALLAGLAATLLIAATALAPARNRAALRRRIDAIASGGKDPGRPAHSDGLNRAFERLVRIWRGRIEKLAAEAATAPRVLDMLPDPLLLIDAERRITRANLAARELAGIDLAGHDLAAGLRHPELANATDRVLAGEGGQWVEITLPVPVERSFSVRVEPLGEDSPDAAVIAFHDLTAPRQTERMRADFVANVSHELRTPLASLAGYIETLRGPARDDAEARAKFLAIMDGQARRMTRLVEDLLSLARIEMDEHTIPREEVAPGPLLKEVADGLASQASARNQTIGISVPPDTPPVAGDRDQLAEVFENLIGNAVKYGKEGGAVRVSVTAGPPGEIAISVEDEGEGIPAEHIPRLTERFYRVDAARSRERGGTGLGLAIVKHIVSRHRGRLSITSTPGQGSRFTVTLPLAEEAARAETAAV